MTNRLNCYGLIHFCHTRLILLWIDPLFRNCCLTDFGLCKDLSLQDFEAKATHSLQEKTANSYATMDYVAPEVVHGMPYDQNVDWWSLGALIFELTVGVVPSVYTQFGNILPSQNQFRY